jgi:hypothetical protein
LGKALPVASKSWIVPAQIGVLLLATAGLWWRAATRPTAPLAPGTPAAQVGRETPAAPLGGRTPTAAQVLTLQAQSDAACRCARRLGDDPWNAGCWAEFNRDLSRFAHSETATACGEESVSLECFGGGFAGEPCVSTQRSYGACSDEEERDREARAHAGGERGCSD